MSKVLFIALSFMLCIGEHLTLAATFSCGELTPAECKTKFGQQFEHKALELQIKTAREIFTNYINLTSTVKLELNAKNPYFHIIEENIKNLENILKELSQTDHAQERLIEIITKGMHTMEIDTTRADIDKGITNQIKQLFEVYHISSTLGKCVHKFLVELSRCWSELYENLRQADLDEFPAYVHVNGYMLSLRDEGKNAEKIAEFQNAKMLLFEEFHLQLFQEENSFF